MANTDEKVMQMVEQELAKNPDASVDELFDKAKSLNASIGKLTRRQFHARYPLQVKRRANAGKRPKKARKRTARKTATKATRGRASGGKKGAPAGNGREAVRQVFLQFAQDLAAAEARKDLVRVLLEVDGYVDDAIRLAGK